MTLSNKLLATLIFLTLTFNSYGGIGLSDWTCQTPNGNEIQNNGEVYLSLKNGQILHGLNGWLFYKDFIIGKRDSTYFIVDEKTSSIHTFRNEREWIKFIKLHNLNPFIWTRWYDTDWEYFDDIMFICIVFFYISIPILFLFIWVVYKSIRHEKLNFKKPFTITLTVIIAFVMANYLLENFPQSL